MTLCNNRLEEARRKLTLNVDALRQKVSIISFRGFIPIENERRGSQTHIQNESLPVGRRNDLTM